MTITLVIWACLASSPADCRSYDIPFDGPIFACAIHGQQAIAEWKAAHPNRTVTRWRCETGRAA